MADGPLRIVHLASLARSGETLVQRSLAAHPQVQVVFDLTEPNTPRQLALFELLRVWPADTLPRWQFADRVAPGATVLLLKQGIFAPRHAAQGFGLLRNPYAAFVSLWHYEARRRGEPADRARNLALWRRFRAPRLLAWADAMRPDLVATLRAERDPLCQFLLFWHARVAQIVAQQKTLVHYEDFVRRPEPELRRLCAAIGLPWEPAMLQSHRRFRPGQLGHGGIDLGAPIRPAPDWQPDPQVPLAPFVEAVRQAPLRCWDGLYAREPVAVPA
jgi:Sulfotransferase family